MAYDIQDGKFRGVQVADRRGRHASYPFTQLRIGQWFLVPQEEEMKLWRAAQYARKAHGIKIDVMMSEDSKYWIVVRKE